MSHYDDQMEWLKRHADSGPAAGVCKWAWQEIKRLAKVEAADALLREIHVASDSGQLDGVDLDWMVRADAYVLGEAAEKARDA